MRRAAIIAVAAGAALVAGAGVTWWLLVRDAGPEATARDFLTALADGDGDGAVALMTGIDGDAEAAASALAEADAWIGSPQVGEISLSDDTATVDVDFELGGESRTAALPLARSGAGWRVEPGALGVATVSTTIGDTVAIGDDAFPADAAVALLPAVYDVVAMPDTVLAGSAGVIVLPGGDASGAIQASLRPEATSMAQERIDEYSDGCTVAADAVPEHCGIRVPWGADLATLSHVAFRVEQYPILTIDDDAAGFVADSGVLVATASGTTRDGGDASFTYRTDAWTLRGDISFAHGEMTLAVR